jgi:Metal-sensitive transcriptional repressor
VLKRRNYIEGHLGGIRKMVEEDKYCVVDALPPEYRQRAIADRRTPAAMSLLWRLAPGDNLCQERL